DVQELGFGETAGLLLHDSGHEPLENGQMPGVGQRIAKCAFISENSTQTDVVAAAYLTLDVIRISEQCATQRLGTLCRFADRPDAAQAAIQGRGVVDLLSSIRRRPYREKPSDIVGLAVPHGADQWRMSLARGRAVERVLRVGVLEEQVQRPPISGFFCTLE